MAAAHYRLCHKDFFPCAIACWGDLFSRVDGEMRWPQLSSVFAPTLDAPDRLMTHLYVSVMLNYEGPSGCTWVPSRPDTSSGHSRLLIKYFVSSAADHVCCALMWGCWCGRHDPPPAVAALQPAVASSSCLGTQAGPAGGLLYLQPLPDGSPPRLSLYLSRYLLHTPGRNPCPSVWMTGFCLLAKCFISSCLFFFLFGLTEHFPCCTIISGFMSVSLKLREVKGFYLSLFLFALCIAQMIGHSRPTVL